MRKVLQILGVGALVLVVLFGIGEIYVRTSISGGLDGVFSTALATAAAGEPESKDGIGAYLPDTEIGYRPNPAAPGRNSLGLRGVEPEVPKPADVFRILILGDSIGAGKDAFAPLLGRRLSASARKPRIEVFDASVPGYTIVQKRQYAERVLAKLQPDLVLLAYSLDDNMDRHRRLLSEGGFALTQEAKRAYVAGSFAAEADDGAYSFLALEFKYRLAKDGMVIPGPNPWDRREDVSVAWREQGWPVFTENLRRLDTAVADSGARLAVMVFPFHNQLDRRFLESNREAVLAPQSRVSAGAARLGVKVLDLHPLFIAHGDRTLFSDGFHLTDNAQRIVSEELLDWIFKSGLIDRNAIGS